jgi:hypothetical protein
VIAAPSNSVIVLIGRNPRTKAAYSRIQTLSKTRNQLRVSRAPSVAGRRGMQDLDKTRSTSWPMEARCTQALD